MMMGYKAVMRDIRSKSGALVSGVGLRRRGLLVALCFAVVLGAAPIVLAYKYQAIIMRDTTAQRMAGYSNRIMARSEMHLNLAKLAIVKAEASNLSPCSQAHILLMRQLTMNTRSIDEIEYFDDGHQLACSGWGREPHPHPVRVQPYTTLADGSRLFRSYPSAIPGAKPALALAHGHYVALINPERLVDTIVNPAVTIAILTPRGDLIGEKGDDDAVRNFNNIYNNRDGADEPYFVNRTVHPAFTALSLSRNPDLDKHVQSMIFAIYGVSWIATAIILTIFLAYLRKRFSLEGELRYAIKRKKFEVYYQPIINIKDGKCIGAEALLRWKSDYGNDISPDLFIDIAERKGLIEPITDILFASVACDMFTYLVSHPELYISFNIAGGDIQTGRFAPVLESLLEQHCLPAEQIRLETTERSFIEGGHLEEPADLGVARMR